MGHFRVSVCLGFEVSLGTQLLKGNDLICIRIRTFDWLCISTRFETAACSNSEKANLGQFRERVLPPDAIKISLLCNMIGSFDSMRHL